LPANLPRSQQLQNETILIVKLIAACMHLLYSRRYQEHLRMHFQGLREYCTAIWRHGGIGKYLELQLRAMQYLGGFHVVSRPIVLSLIPHKTLSMAEILLIWMLTSSQQECYILMNTADAKYAETS
jgi:hypothetical protein